MTDEAAARSEAEPPPYHAVFVAAGMQDARDQVHLLRYGGTTDGEPYWELVCAAARDAAGELRLRFAPDAELPADALRELLREADARL